MALGYTDAWTLRPGNRPGSTCCQGTDLMNMNPALDQQIDIRFSSEPLMRIEIARVLADEISFRVRSGSQFATYYGAM